MNEEGVSGQSYESSSEDELYDKAVDIVIKSRKASISNVQRRLRIGYNRAASLIEAMEEAGVVTPMKLTVAVKSSHKILKEVNNE